MSGLNADVYPHLPPHFTHCNIRTFAYPRIRILPPAIASPLDNKQEAQLSLTNLCDAFEISQGYQA